MFSGFLEPPTVPPYRNQHCCGWMVSCLRFDFIPRNVARNPDRNMSETDSQITEVFDVFNTEHPASAKSVRTSVVKRDPEVTDDETDDEGTEEEQAIHHLNMCLGIVERDLVELDLTVRNMKRQRDIDVIRMNVAFKLLRKWQKDPSTDPARARKSTGRKTKKIRQADPMAVQRNVRGSTVMQRDTVVRTPPVKKASSRRNITMTN